MPRTPKSLAIIRLQKSLEAIPELKLLKSGCPQFTKWRRNTQVAIINTFGSNSDHINEFNKIRYTLCRYLSQGDRTLHFREHMKEACKLRNRYSPP